MSRPERYSDRLSRPGSPRVCLTRPGLAARMCWSFRDPLAQRFLLGRCIEQHVSRLLQPSYNPASAFKLPRPLRSELLVDLPVQVCFAGRCLFGTVVLRIFLCRMRLTT